MRYYRLVGPVLLVGALTSLFIGSCAKKNPSGPGQPAGDPVLLRYTPQINMHGQVVIDGMIFNKSNWTIYDVRLVMTVYVGDPVFGQVTDTSDVAVASLPDEDSASFHFEMVGERFINAWAIWELLPPKTLASAPVAAVRLDPPSDSLSAGRAACTVLPATARKY